MLVRIKFLFPRFVVMKSDLMVILDNSMFTINQDYLPGRLNCQIETVKRTISSKLDESTESTVGIMTIGRRLTTKIASPTTDKTTLYSYLHAISRDTHMAITEVVPIARMALQFRTNTTQSILLFLSSPAPEADLRHMVHSINEVLANNISVRVALFGEATEYYNLFKEGVEESSEFTCVQIGPEDDFEEMARVAMREEAGAEEMDPDLALAIKLSLEAEGKPAQESSEEKLVQEAIKKSLEDQKN